MPDLSLVLPCYNEAPNLQNLFLRLDRLAKEMPGIEIILVDNGSNDDSSVILQRELSQRNEHIFRSVRIEENIGYGNGILVGLRHARAEVLGWTHADIQTDPMDLVTAFKLWQSHGSEVVLVKGSRQKRKAMESIFSLGMALLASCVLGKWLNEINAQPKVFSKEFFHQIQQSAPLDFSLDLYFLYMGRTKGKVLSFPVEFANRTAGEAKGGSGSSWRTRSRLIKRSVKYIFELNSHIKKLKQ